MKDFYPTVLDKLPKPDGGPAFPIQCHLSDHHHGLSLRDYFAGQVLAMLAQMDWEPERVALFAYEVADKMLAEREK